MAVPKSVQQIERNAQPRRNTPAPRRPSSSQAGYADYLKKLAAAEGTQQTQYLMPNRNVQSSGVGSMTQANLADGWSTSENRFLNGAAPTPPGPTPPGPGGPGGGYDREAALQVSAFQQLLNSRAFTAKDIAPDMAAVASAVSADQAASDAEYGKLATYMGGLGNAYQGQRVAQSPQVSPELLQLLSASGADGRAYEAQVGLANTQGAQSTAAGQQLMDRMTQVAAESKTSRLAETEQARVFRGQELGSQRAALEAALQKRQRDEQSALDQQKMQVVMQLIAAMAKGGQRVDVSQFFGGK